MLKRIVLTLAALACALLAGMAAAEDVGLDVANTTPMEGNFFIGQWGNSTTDIDVRELLHAYDLVMWDVDNGMFTVDPTVVSGMVVTEDAAGDRTYTMALYEDLYYSDGTQITAWDYAFSYLLVNSREIAGLGGTFLPVEGILGASDYAAGRSNVLRGVSVMNDFTLAVTLDRAYLPFFYEMGLLMCKPYPISQIAPGVTVMDNGGGVFLSGMDENQQPLFTTELLRRTLLDPEAGYNTLPRVVSGPYRITYWDGETAAFEANPYYKGNVRGEKPQIPRLTFTRGYNATMVDQLHSGELGLLNKVTNKDVILAGMGQSAMSNYPRLGLSYVRFLRDFPREVRQAIAWCMDRDAIVEEYVSSFGVCVDGYYGLGQWMYGLIEGNTTPPVTPPENPDDAAAQAAYEAEMAAWKELSLDGLTHYTVDLERAAALLDAAGYPADPQTGLRPLTLTLVYPRGNTVVSSLRTHMQANLAEIGVTLRLTEDPAGADMVYMASDFQLVFEPAWYFTGEVRERAMEMRHTEPNDVLGYMRRWIAFQEAVNEELPLIPVYSNIYFDFYREDLQNYMIGENITWSRAIVGAYLGEPAEEEAEDNGLLIFE